MEIQKEINSKESRIIELKTKLRQSDFRVIRMDSEGYPVDEDLLQEREGARVEIRKIEDELIILNEELKDLKEEIPTE